MFGYGNGQIALGKGTLKLLRMKFLNKGLNFRQHIAAFGCLWMLFISMQAQNPAEITKIREVYAEIGDKIAECRAAESPEECRLYLNSLTVNKMNSPWAAVGNYGAVRDFWFERGSMEGENGPSYVLRKIEIKSVRSAHDQNEEYLFDSKGNLLFYFFKEHSGNNDQSCENRFYFKGDKLVHYTEKVNEEEAEYQIYHEADAGLVLKQAQRLSEFFQRTL
jgi:hypothetical protein